MTEARPAEQSEFQEVVDERFTTLSQYWRDLYFDRTLFGIVHQERHQRALAWIAELGLPKGARVLDLGCGAGIQAVALAEYGYVVDGLDPAAAMVELGAERAKEHGVTDRARFVQGDAHSLPYPDDSFDLVMALGVMPYLYAPPVALAEVARVLKPRSAFLFSSNNANRLNHLLDPRFSPVTYPAKEIVHRILRGRFRHPAPVRTFSLRALRHLLGETSFSIERYQSYGFGPFTFLGRAILRENVAVRLHNRLQSLADRGMPLLNRTGDQHLVLARAAG